MLGEEEQANQGGKLRVGESHRMVSVSVNGGDAHLPLDLLEGRHTLLPATHVGGRRPHDPVADRIHTCQMSTINRVSPPGASGSGRQVRSDLAPNGPDD